MDSDKFNLFVIGNSISHLKWNRLYETLDGNSDDIDYEKIDVTNNEALKKIKKVDCAGYIYLACTPKFKDKPYVKLLATASDDDIDEALTELCKLIFSVEVNNDTTIPVEFNETIINDYNTSNNPSILHDCEDINYSNLVGVKIEVNNKEVVIDKEDMSLLKELVNLINNAGFKVKDIIIK